MDRLLKPLVLGAMLLVAPGCSLFKNDKLQYFQSENDRLIREYREQRDLAARLEVQNRALVSRVSQLEGKLAAITDAVRDPLNELPRNYPSGLPGMPASMPLQPATQLPSSPLPNPSAPTTNPLPTNPSPTAPQPATQPWRPAQSS